MTKDCSLNYEFSTWQLQTQYMLCTQIVLNVETKNQFVYTTCTVTRNSMNNLSSYCGLVDARISASDIDLPVLMKIHFKSKQTRHFMEKIQIS